MPFWYTVMSTIEFFQHITQKKRYIPPTGWQTRYTGVQFKIITCSLIGTHTLHSE